MQLYTDLCTALPDNEYTELISTLSLTLEFKSAPFKMSTRVFTLFNSTALTAATEFLFCGLLNDAVSIHATGTSHRMVGQRMNPELESNLNEAAVV
jgi:hypothetical protein